MILTTKLSFSWDRYPSSGVACCTGLMQKSDMEKQNSELHLENCRMMLENERLRKKAERLNQENQVLSGLKQRLLEANAVHKNDQQLKTSSTSATTHNKCDKPHPQKHN